MGYTISQSSFPAHTAAMASSNHCNGYKTELLSACADPADATSGFMTNKSSKRSLSTAISLMRCGERWECAKVSYMASDGGRSYGQRDHHFWNSHHQHNSSRDFCLVQFEVIRRPPPSSLRFRRLCNRPPHTALEMVIRKS